MNPTVSLRPAVPSDWAAIAALLAANRLPLAGAREHLHSFLVAVSNGEVVGTAGAEIYGDVALIRSVAVAPGLHRKGVGRMMLDRWVDEARRRSIHSLHLLTTTAAPWFERFGFQVADRARVPAAIKASAEFNGTCPGSATFMSMDLAAADADPAALPVAVLGAGPVGLSAAARLVERGIPFLLLESGSDVGANLLNYGHVRLFSPWQYNIDEAMASQLAATGWQPPAAEQLPLAREIVERVLQPFAALPQISRSLHLRTRVLSVSREGFDKVKSAGREQAPFVIRALQDGRPIEWRARAVIDATGTWNQPNPIGANGLPALGEAEAADRVFYGIPDVIGVHRQRYAGKRTLVVGAGHSAANALLALAELAHQSPGTSLLWSVRSPMLTRVFGGGDDDALPARGQLGASLRSLRDSGALQFVPGLRITEIRHERGGLDIVGLGLNGERITLQGIDEIVCATGQRPDLSLASELRLKLDPWLESTEALGPLIDPNLHSCGTVRPHGHRELAHPEPGLYTVGVKSYGRAPTFLMATGFEQARSVVAAIAGDLEAADRVELDLPETGVCSVGAAAAAPAGHGCCATAAQPAPAVTMAAASCGTSLCGPKAKELAVAPVRCCS